MEKSINILISSPDIIVATHLQEPPKVTLNINGLETNEVILLLSQMLTQLIINQQNQSIQPIINPQTNLQ